MQIFLFVKKNKYLTFSKMIKSFIFCRKIIIKMMKTRAITINITPAAISKSSETSESILVTSLWSVAEENKKLYEN